MAGEAATPTWRAGWGLRLLSLAPFVVASWSYLTPSYFHPMGALQPELLGLPFGAWVYVWFLTLGALGATIVWRTINPVIAGVAFLTCTLPATFGVLLGPTVILILENLHSGL